MSGMSKGLFLLNTKKCEESKTEICVCKCKGEFHKQKHPKNWMRKMWNEIKEDQLESD